MLVGFLLSAAVQGYGKEGANYSSGVHFDSLQSGSRTFTNVLVYSHDSQQVFFRHEQGLSCAPLTELDAESLAVLGLTVQAPPPAFGSSFWAMLTSQFSLAASELSPFGLASLLVILILAVGLYLYCCFLFWLICVKVGAEPGISVWLPVVQVLPLLRAAEMSVLGPLTLLLLFVGSFLAYPHLGVHSWTLGLLSGVGAVVCFLTWSVKICRRRKKSSALAGLLLVPGINFFVLLYLAGSK